MMKKHLAIMNKDIIEAILSGKKTVESRFSQKKVAPFAQISVGDIVYMKPQGREIMGQFKVKKAAFFEGIDRADIDKIFTDYGQQIGLWKVEEGVKYATLIFITASERFITPPVKIEKKDRRGWVVLD